MNRPYAPLAAFLMICWMGPALAGDWITAPSYYTHDPMSGKRVTQYSPIGPFYTYSESSFTRSGYRNSRSSIQVGTSADHYHTTEQWGPPVQPYGEWRFPFRPHSVPYDQWGPQFFGGFPLGIYPPGFGLGLGGGGFPGGGFPGGGFPGGGFPGGGFPGGGFPGGGFPGGGAFPPGQGGMQRRPYPGPNPFQPGYSGQQQLLDGRYPPFERLDPFERKQLFDHLYPPRPGAGN